MYSYCSWEILLVQGINTVFLTTTYFLLVCSFREVALNDRNVGLGLLLSIFDIFVVLSFFDTFVFLSLLFFFSNDIFLIGQFKRASFFFTVGVFSRDNKCFGLERIDLSVNSLLIFLFTSIPLQHLQRLSPSPSPFSLWTFKVTGSHHCIHSLSRRSTFGLLLHGDSFLSHVAFSSCSFFLFRDLHFFPP